MKPIHLRKVFCCCWMTLLVCCGAQTDLSGFLPNHTPTLGQDIFIVLCEHAAALDHPEDVSGQKSKGICHQGAAPDPIRSPRLQAVYEAKKPLIRTIDQTIDARLQQDLQEFIEQTLPLVEQGIIPQASQAIAEWLNQLSTREQAVQALAYIYGQQGYVPPPWQANLSQAIFHYPQLPGLMQITLDTMQLSPAIQQAWLQWLASMHVLLRQETSSSATSHTLQQWLLHERIESRQPANSALLVAKRDHRGLVRPSANAGKLSGPFVDQDGDGFADIDPLGRFINQQGKRLAVPTPLPALFQQEEAARDQLGRAMQSDNPMYQYRHLHRTLLADLLQSWQAMQQVGKLPLGELLQSLRATLGAAVPVEQQEGIQLWAHDSSQGLLFAVAEPLLALVRTPQGAALLQLLQQVLQQHPQALPTLLNWWHQVHLPEQSHQVQLNHQRQLWQAFAAHMEQLQGHEQLLEQLLQVWGSKERDGLGQILAQHMRYKDKIAIPSQQSTQSEPTAWQELVDYALPDSEDNQSIMQRLLYLIYNTTDAKLCNQAGAAMMIAGYLEAYHIDKACDGFSVESMAKFYLQSIARHPSQPEHGKAAVQVHDPILAALPDGLWDRFLPWQSGIPGFGRYPTTPAVNRALFAAPNVFMRQLIEPGVGRDGRLLQEAHQGTIFAWEQLGFYDAIRPLLQTYADAEQEDLALDLLGFLHRFWGTKQGNLRSLEPWLAYFLGEAHGLLHTGQWSELVLQTQVATPQGLQSGSKIVAAFVQLLFDSKPFKQAALPTLPQRELSIASPRTIADWLWNLGVVVQAWQSDMPAIPWRAVFTQLLATNKSSTGEVRWQNRSIEPILHHVSHLLQVKQPAQNFEQALSSSQNMLVAWRQLAAKPFVYSTLQLVEEMMYEPALRDEMENFLIDLLNADNGRPSKDGIMVMFSQLLEVHGTDALLHPLIQAVAPLFDPNKGPIALSTSLLQILGAYDHAQVTPRLLASFSTFIPKQQGLLWQHLLKVWLTINRLEPTCQQALSPEDWQHVLRQLQTFLTEEEHGLERLYTILRQR